MRIVVLRAVHAAPSRSVEALGADGGHALRLFGQAADALEAVTAWPADVLLVDAADLAASRAVLSAAGELLGRNPGPASQRVFACLVPRLPADFFAALDATPLDCLAHFVFLPDDLSAEEIGRCLLQARLPGRRPAVMLPFGLPAACRDNLLGRWLSPSTVRFRTQAVRPPLGRDEMERIRLAQVVGKSLAPGQANPWFHRPPGPPVPAAAPTVRVSPLPPAAPAPAAPARVPAAPSCFPPPPLSAARHLLRKTFRLLRSLPGRFDPAKPAAAAAPINLYQAKADLAAPGEVLTEAPLDDTPR